MHLQLILILIFFISPVFIIFLTGKSKLANRIGAIIIAYGFGLFIGNVGIIPVASIANFQRLMDISGALISLISIVIFGSLLVHTILSKIYKVDADTLMVTSTALICSPPFVPMVAGALNNKEVIVSGLTVGIVGYAARNYLGVLMSMVLNQLM